MKTMGYIPITSFRRMVDAAQLQQHHLVSHPLPDRAISKWDALRELATARASFGLTDRDLTVLQALLSFYPGTNLDRPEKLVVHPSNDSICDRLNGMPCSTMRRHLAKLVAAGVIARRDSPNGKRYVRRSSAGPLVYGFDLSPLARRFEEFAAIARQVKADEQRLDDLRHSISLMRRDLRGLIELQATQNPTCSLEQFNLLLEITGRDLRRKFGLTELDEMARLLESALARMGNDVVPLPTEAVVTIEMSTSPARNEQHYQNLKKELRESEVGTGIEPHPLTTDDITLPTVIAACPEITSYSEGPVRHWIDFYTLAEKVRPMMGVCAATWQNAKKQLGAVTAAVVLAAILQRLGNIRSPAAYLRSLSNKAQMGQFLPGPMIQALIRSSGSSQL